MPPAPTPKIIPHARAYRKQNSNIGYKSAPHTFAPAKGRNICRPHAASKSDPPAFAPASLHPQKLPLPDGDPDIGAIAPARSYPQRAFSDAPRRTRGRLVFSPAHMHICSQHKSCYFAVNVSCTALPGPISAKKRGRHSRPLFILKNCHRRGNDTTQGNLPRACDGPGGS